MEALRISRDIEAPPEQVWKVLTDLEGSPEVISGITSVELLDSGTDFGVGTTWRETRVMFGREATEVMEIVAVDEGSSYVAEANGRGARYRTTLSVSEAEGGSRLTMTFDAQPTGLVSKFFGATLGKLFAGATRKAIEKDLEDIAAAAEAA